MNVCAGCGSDDMQLDTLCLVCACCGKVYPVLTIVRCANCGFEIETIEHPAFKGTFHDGNVPIKHKRGIGKTN